MLFCETCGALKEPVRSGSQMEHRCRRCDGTPPARARGGDPRDRVFQVVRPEPTFTRADTLPMERAGKRFEAADPAPARPAPSGPEGGSAPALTDSAAGAGRFFPFPTMRKGQAEFIADVRGALRDRKIVIAQVPTGLGKTAGVLAPALEVAAETGARIFFLTPKQSQHRVVIETLRMAEAASGVKIVVSDMIAKRAMCPRTEAVTLGARGFGEFCSKAMAKGTCTYYEEDETEVVQILGGAIHHVEEAVRVSTDHHVCPYKALTEVARVAEVVVLDYNHFFSDMLAGTLDRFRIALANAILVVDEAHNLPERIRAHLSRALHATLVSEAATEARSRRVPPLVGFLELLEEHIGTLGPEEIAFEPEDLLGPLEEMLSRSYRLHAPSLADLVLQLKDIADKTRKEEAYSACGELAEFLEQWPVSAKREERTVLRMWSPDDNAILLRELDAAKLARPIFEEVRGAVLMSGTLFPMEMYSSILGVPPGRSVHKLYPNPFPRENRRVVIDTAVTTALAQRTEETFAAIGARLGAVCEATVGNVAAFFPSYQLLERCYAAMPRTERESVIEERGFDKVEREALVTRVRGARGNALLLAVQGGSLSEGYDFVEGEDNLLAAVVVVGIPYAVPTLEVKALQTFYDASFGAGKGWLYGYLVPAVQKTLQAAGRAVRAEHHRAFVALLDSRFRQRQVLNHFPPDVAPLVVASVGDECARFFQAASH